MSDSSAGFRQPQGNLGHRHGVAGREGLLLTNQTPRILGLGVPPANAFTTFSSTFSDPGATNLGLLSPNGLNSNFSYSQQLESSQTAAGNFTLHNFDDGFSSTQAHSTSYMQRHPMDRFRHGGEDPWNAQRLVGQSDNAPNRAVHFETWPGPVRTSDTGSHGMGRPRSDSGYSTAPRSVFNGHAGSQDVSDVMSNLGKFQPYGGRRYSSSRHSNASGTPRRSEDLKCPYCKDVFRVNSDLKKHVLKHEKPFKCNRENCDRALEGFPTINDLARHQASVHKMYLEGSKVYLCSSANCADRGKIWSRLDNFRSHIKQMHAEENLVDLINRSSRTVGIESSQTSDPSQTNAYQPLFLPLVHASNQANNGALIAESSITPNLQTPGLTNAQPQVGWGDGQHPRDRNLSIAPHSLSDGYFRNPLSLGNGHDAVQRIVPSSHDPTDPSEGALGTLADAATVSLPLETFENYHVSSEENKNANVILHQDPKQQQEQDLAHLSLAIASHCEKRPAAEKMEDTILKVLKNFGSSTVLKRTLDLVDSEDADDSSQSSRARSIRDEGSWYTCDHCPKTFRLRCHLAKHRSRHSRLFACTADHCDYAGGTKNDWKRHENTEHFQSEAWRCNLTVDPNCASNVQSSVGLPETPPTECAKAFKHRGQFFKHLQNVHHVEDENERRRISEERRVGANGQTRFWCGFCRDLVTLEQRGTRAWNERFDHIGRHFTEHGCKIEDWLSFELDKRKGDAEQSKKAGSRKNRNRHKRLGNDALLSNTAQRPPEAITSKRCIEEDFDFEPVRYCCLCVYEPIPGFSDVCPTCRHEVCPKCREPERKKKQRS